MYGRHGQPLRTASCQGQNGVPKKINKNVGYVIVFFSISVT